MLCVIRGFFVLIFTISFLTPLFSQAPQATGEVALDKYNYSAGDEFGGSIKLQDPAPCDTRVYVNFNFVDPRGGNGNAIMSGVVRSGEQVIKLTGHLAKDLSAGEYSSSRTYLNPCEGYSNPVYIETNKTLKMAVAAYPNPVKFPTSADIVLTGNQEQFFNTKISELTQLSVDLTNHLELNAADTPELREFLAKILLSARKALDATEKQYREEILKSKGEPPSFFLEFRKQYDNLLIEARAPIPGARAAGPQDASLILVQAPLKSRKTTNNRSGTIPALAGKTDETLNDNISVYTTIKSGRLTFNVSIKSRPSDARVHYRKVIDANFTDLPKNTDVPLATFDLGTYIFTFDRDGCTDEPSLRIKGLELPVRDIFVEFTHCGPQK